MRYVPHKSEIEAFKDKHNLVFSDAKDLLRSGYHHPVHVPFKHVPAFMNWVNEQNFTSPQYRYCGIRRYFFKDKGVATMVKLMFT